MKQEEEEKQEEREEINTRGLRTSRHTSVGSLAEYTTNK